MKTIFWHFKKFLINTRFVFKIVKEKGELNIEPVLLSYIY